MSFAQVVKAAGPVYACILSAVVLRQPSDGLPPGCCVCARLHWADELQRVHFWRQPPDAPERSLLCDDDVAGRRNG